MKKYTYRILIGVVGLLTFVCIPFLFEILLGTFLFTLHAQRKEKFEKRLLASAAVAFLLSLITFRACYASNVWFVKTILCYLLVFIFSLLVPFTCYEERTVNLLFSAVSGYMVQHIGSQFLQMFWSSDMLVETSNTMLLLFLVCQFICYGILYFLIYWFFLRKTRGVQLPDGMNRDFLGVAIMTLLVVLILSGVRDSFAEESFILMAVSRLYSVFCCVFLLFLRWGMLERIVSEQEKEQMIHLHALQREQYEQSKKNIEMINIKCHDLKHRVGQWEQQGGWVDPEEICQVKNMIGIYDSVVKTENETLDVILTERSLYCEKHGISLACMVDGSKLNFMSTSDICALFGNALENAIEAVLKLENKEDRIISFQVRQNRGMLIVTVDNYFSGRMNFVQDLPETTKKDPENHGYGLKSIRMVAEKYGGEMTVMTDEMFHLTILLPLPENV